MRIDDVEVAAHHEISGGYRLLALAAPEISELVRPGQFIHMRMPGGDVEFTLRRPFSVFKAEGGQLSVLYKVVGRGTHALAGLRPGDGVSVVGPLGNGFPMDLGDAVPVLVAGGYGVAPLCLLASRLDRPGFVFIGGASSSDILCNSDFESLGWPVTVATEDGTAGVRGLVTAALDMWIEGCVEEQECVFFACGPDGLLKAVGERAMRLGVQGWLSLDKHMGCGMGACLACVQRIRNADGEECWARVCKDGPVFEARQIVWPQE